MLTFPPHHFKSLICTGGIGSGALFLLSGNHTLGREESRGGKYLDARDYCKMHIIAQNFKKLSDHNVPTFAIGKVGDDAVGKEIIEEMREAEIDVRYVDVSAGDRTMFGFCFLYPDGTGGNLTTEESACSKVGARYIEEKEDIFRQYKGAFLALAAPEVPLDARLALLRLSDKYGGFSVASFTVGEMPAVEQSGMLSLVQLLAVNIEEALAFAGADVSEDPAMIVRKLIDKAKKYNSRICLSVTAGKRGSWTWDGTELNFVASLTVDVKSSAGAGDAYISGIMAGLNGGLRLSEAQQLGNLAGALAVTSQHTIHPEMSRKKIADLIDGRDNSLSSALLKYLSNK